MFCYLVQSDGGGTVLAGLFAAIVAVVGWLAKSFVSGVLFYHARFTADIERMTALEAEINSNIKSEGRFADPALENVVRARYDEDPAYRHFIPMYREDVVFDSIKTNITSIPANVIESVVRYYNASNGLDVLLNALSEERYEGLPPSRKVEIFKSCIAVATDVVAQGKVALTDLADQLSRTRVVRIANALLLVVVPVCLVGFVMHLHAKMPACGIREKTASLAATAFQPKSFKPAGVGWAAS